MTSTVYVLEAGSYDERGIVGVFATLEAAMQAHPGEWKASSSGDFWAVADEPIDDISPTITRYEVHE